MAYNIRDDDHNIDSYDVDSTNALEDLSYADLPMSHEDIIKNNVFVGTTPFDVIIEGLECQFTDYINMEDKTNYVDVFYEQLYSSYDAVDDSETFRDEMIRTLDDIHQKFIDKIIDLFNLRLTITIPDVESESVDMRELEFVIGRLYEFFILNARKNFKIVIANEMKEKINNISDHKTYIRSIDNMISNNYSPLITIFGPIEFLKYRGDQEIIELFESGKVVGNFLRKYTPKFYMNDEFKVEVITYVTMVKEIKEEVYNHGGKQQPIGN